jgi:hypothetical protein
MAGEATTLRFIEDAYQPAPTLWALLGRTFDHAPEPPQARRPRSAQPSPELLRKRQVFDLAIEELRAARKATVSVPEIAEVSGLPPISIRKFPQAGFHRITGRGAPRLTGTSPRLSPPPPFRKRSRFAPASSPRPPCRHLTSAGLRRTLAKCWAAGPIRWAGSNQRVRRFPLIIVDPGNRRLGLILTAEDACIKAREVDRSLD